MNIPFRSNGKPTKLDEALIDRLTTDANIGPMLKVRPYADSPGYDDAAKFMKSLYSDSGGERRRNILF